MKKLSWRKLQAVLNQLTEEQVLAMLEEERATLKRASILERLHMKYSVLRTNRERIEIMKEAVRP
jgi:predicted transcriptional regulator